MRKKKKNLLVFGTEFCMDHCVGMFGVQEDRQQWKGMRRAYGGVWDMVSPPKGALTLRVLASDNDGQKWFQMRNVIPADWKAGVPYDSAFELF